jgi:N-acetylmuramoyl-L-alanine amidase
MVLAGAASLGIAPRVFADAPAIVRAIEIAPGEGRAALNIALSRPVSPRTFFLGGPARFVVDLPDTRFAGAPAGQGPGGGFIRGYRYALRPEGARVVLDLEGPASLESLETGNDRAPGLRLELASGAIPTAAPVPNESPRDGRRRVIVIDAGHGGHDPGAVGVTGVREKDVVLDAALQLRDALESRGRYRVELTRDADTFIPLQNRVNFARAQGAELFISLHADAAANHDAAGASVYTLSDRGSQRSRNMMDSQNWIVDTGGARDGVVSDILVDLAQRETTNRSAVFAQTAIRELQGAAPLLANTHRSAGFFVLLAPDVPAVLIEMGFLTNGVDERRLADQRQRHRMAGKLADAVDHYFAPSRTYMTRA